MYNGLVYMMVKAEQEALLKAADTVRLLKEARAEQEANQKKHRRMAEDIPDKDPIHEWMQARQTHLDRIADAEQLAKQARENLFLEARKEIKTTVAQLNVKPENEPLTFNPRYILAKGQQETVLKKARTEPLLKGAKEDCPREEKHTNLSCVEETCCGEALHTNE